MSSSVITPNSEYHMDTSGGDAANPCADIDERSTQEENSPSLTPQKSKEEPISRVHAPQSDQGGSASAMMREDALQTPDSSALVAHSGHIGNASFAIRERVLDDGYNWRKYGQKNIKGNEYVRGYYRCTYPSCQVKKQLDCSSDGKVSDTVYFGHHIHPKPEEDGPLAARFGVATAEMKPDNRSSNKSAEGKSSSQLGQPPRLIELPVKRVLLPSVAESIKVNDIEAARAESTRIRNEADNEDDMDSKRQKKRKCNVEATLVDKHYGEHRAVVHTVSDVDIVNDGYRWRKYGQKMVKGSPHPRSYYRCSNSGCPAKKHVERASHDPKVVVTTYEGTHDHDLPASRTVTPKTAGLNTSPTSHISKTGSKSEERDVHSLSKASHSISSPETRTVEPQNGKSVIKLQNTEGLGAGTVSSGSSQEIRPKEDQTEKPGAESKVSEHQSGFSSEKGDVIGSRTSDQSCGGLDSGLSGQPNVKSRESDVVNTVSIARSADIVGNGNEQERANSEAIKS